jgi:hypothetical protein
MKYLLVLMLGICAASCSHNIRDYAPTHVGISPSMEWEVQEGSNTKLKPRIGSSIDWNF